MKEGYVLIDKALAHDIDGNVAQDAIAAERDAGREYATQAAAEVDAVPGKSLVFFDTDTGCGGFTDRIRDYEGMNRYEMRGFTGLPGRPDYENLPIIVLDAVSMDAAFIKARCIHPAYASAQRIH